MEPRALFDGIAGRYEMPATALSLGQYGRWRRALVRGLPLGAGMRVLDVATGTGLVARDLLRRRRDIEVVGLDLTPAMLVGAAGRVRDRVGGDAARLPFPDASFDVVIHSYLLRYVADPGVTLRELRRVVRPGGIVASQEFGIPRAWLARAGWRLYAGIVMPRLAAAFGPAWRDTGRFLPRSITAWAEAWPRERQVSAWTEAGVTDIIVRDMTFGTATLMMGRAHG